MHGPCLLRSFCHGYQVCQRDQNHCRQTGSKTCTSPTCCTSQACCHKSGCGKNRPPCRSGCEKNACCIQKYRIGSQGRRHKTGSKHGTLNSAQDYGSQNYGQSHFYHQDRHKSGARFCFNYHHDIIQKYHDQ